MASSTMTFKLFGHDVSASKTFRDVGKTAAGVASGMGVAFAASKVTDWAKKSMTAFADVGKETLRLQRYMGGSAEDASRLGHAFRMSGINIDQASKGLGILSKHLAAGDDAAKSLGISFQDANGKVKPMGDLLPQIAEKFKNMPPGAERTALAMKLFGRSGADMLPFLSKGAAGIQELMKQSDALGTTMSGKDAQAVKDYTKTQREFKEMIYGVQISLGRALYPTLTKLGTTLLPMLMPKVHEFTKQMGKLPAIIEQKWPMIHDKIKEVFDNLGKVEQKVRDNWPAIKDTFGKVGDALKHVGEWTRYLWDRFQSLPGPVKELIAMLAIAQKTGVLSIAFKGLDFAKNLIARIAGMSVQAGVVNVNGAAPGGKGGAVGKAGWGSIIAGFLGSGAAVATLVAAVAGIAATYYISNGKTPGQTVAETPGSPGQGTFAGTWNGGGGVTTPDWSDRDIAERQRRIQALALAIRDESKARWERVAALKAFWAMGVEEIRHLKDTGASTEEVTKKVRLWQEQTFAQAKALGWTDEQARQYILTLGNIPATKDTKIRADTEGATKGLAAVGKSLGALLNPKSIKLKADDSQPRGIFAYVGAKIGGLLNPNPIKIRADGTEVHGPIADVGAAIGNLLNPPPIKITAKSEVHGPVADAGGAVGRLLHPPPIRITAKSEVHGPVADVGASIGRLLHPPPIKITADGSQAMQVVQSVGAAVGAALGALSALTRRPRTQQWKPPRGAPPGVYVPRQFASGGIVTRATMGIVGEAGPEAVIPLSRARGALGGSPEVHIHVSGSVFATKEQMAREVVAALQNAKNRGLQLNLAG